GGAGDALGEAGEERRHAGDVAVVLAGLVGGAEVDVDDPLRIDAGPLDDRGDRVGGHVVGPDAGGCTAVGAHRGADGVDYECVRHGHGLNRYGVGFRPILGGWHSLSRPSSSSSFSSECWSWSAISTAATTRRWSTGIRPGRPNSKRR